MLMKWCENGTKWPVLYIRCVRFSQLCFKNIKKGYQTTCCLWHFFFFPAHAEAERMRQLDATFSLHSVFNCVAEEILHFSCVFPQLKVHSRQSVLTFLGAIFTATNLFSDSCYFWPRCTQKTFGAGKTASPRGDKTAFIRVATTDCFIKMLLGRTRANWKLKVHLKYSFTKAALWSSRYFTLHRFNFKGQILIFFSFLTL